MKHKIAIFASGNGTNAENIIRTFRGGNRIEVTCVVCNVRTAGVMQRAASLNVPTVYISNKELAESPDELIAELKKQGVDLIVLAGFMRKIPDVMVESFPDAIINIHPSLLPAYGGTGMWGHHVHEAVVAAGEKESGVTVHFVNNVMDGGRILMQESLTLEQGETPETLETKIHEIEYRLYPRAIVAALEDIDNRGKKEAQSNAVAELAATEPEQAVDAGKPDSHATPPPSPDSRWAEALNMEYVPPVVPQAVPEKGPVSKDAPNVVESAGASKQPPQNVSSSDPQHNTPMPPTYMVWSVVMTLLCCLIPGIVAIIYSSKVSSKYYAGDMEGARKASDVAQIWIIVSFVLGVLWATLYFPIMLAGELLKNAIF